MKRVSKYTLVCLLLAAVFALGSTAGMNVILQMRERQRLEESGTVAVESPVLAWQDPTAEDTAAGEGEETGETKEDAERILTVEQMEQVIKYRNHCEGEILHEPAVGQITMEEAIESGDPVPKGIFGGKSGFKCAGSADGVLVQFLDSTLFE